MSTFTLSVSEYPTICPSPIVPFTIELVDATLSITESPVGSDATDAAAICASADIHVASENSGVDDAFRDSRIPESLPSVSGSEYFSKKSDGMESITDDVIVENNAEAIDVKSVEWDSQNSTFTRSASDVTDKIASYSSTKPAGIAPIVSSSVSSTRICDVTSANVCFTSPCCSVPIFDPDVVKQNSASYSPLQGSEVPSCIYTLENVSNAWELLIALVRLLDRKYIPNIVWGQCCMYYHQIPTVVDEISFIIPDAEFDRTVKLFSHHFTRCRCDEDPDRDPRRQYDSETQSWIKTAHYTQRARTTMPSAHFCRSLIDNIELWKASCVLYPLDFCDNSADYVLDTPVRKSCWTEKSGAPRTFINPITLDDTYRVRFMTASLMREIGMFLSIRDVSNIVDLHQWIFYVVYADCYVNDKTLESGFRNDVIGATHREYRLSPCNYKALQDTHVLLFPEIPLNLPEPFIGKRNTTGLPKRRRKKVQDESISNL